MTEAGGGEKEIATLSGNIRANGRDGESDRLGNWEIEPEPLYRMGIPSEILRLLSRVAASRRFSIYT